MNSARLEAFLAWLYTDRSLRDKFLREPETEARRAGLADDEVAALAAIDRTGLQMAAHSFEHKRAAHGRRAKTGLFAWFRA